MVLVEIKKTYGKNGFSTVSTRKCPASFSKTYAPYETLCGLIAIVDTILLLLLLYTLSADESNKRIILYGRNRALQIGSAVDHFGYGTPEMHIY